MFCGINSHQVNEIEINGCRGGIVVTVKHWVDEFIPKPLLYDETSKGLVDCLRPVNRHDSAPKIYEPKLPSKGKREC